MFEETYLPKDIRDCIDHIDFYVNGWYGICYFKPEYGLITLWGYEDSYCFDSRNELIEIIRYSVKLKED